MHANRLIDHFRLISFPSLFRCICFGYWNVGIQKKWQVKLILLIITKKWTNSNIALVKLKSFYFDRHSAKSSFKKSTSPQKNWALISIAFRCNALEKPWLGEIPHQLNWTVNLRESKTKNNNFVFTSFLVHCECRLRISHLIIIW
jgi:hypothetical protein